MNYSLDNLESLQIKINSLNEHLHNLVRIGFIRDGGNSSWLRTVYVKFELTFAEYKTWRTEFSKSDFIHLNLDRRVSGKDLKNLDPKTGIAKDLTGYTWRLADEDKILIGIQIFGTMMQLDQFRNQHLSPDRKAVKIDSIKSEVVDEIYGIIKAHFSGPATHDKKIGFKNGVVDWYFQSNSFSHLDDEVFDTQRLEFYEDPSTDGYWADEEIEYKKWIGFVLSEYKNDDGLNLEFPQQDQK